MMLHFACSVAQEYLFDNRGADGRPMFTNFRLFEPCGCCAQVRHVRMISIAGGTTAPVTAARLLPGLFTAGNSGPEVQSAIRAQFAARNGSLLGIESVLKSSKKQLATARTKRTKGGPWI